MKVQERLANTAAAPVATATDMAAYQSKTARGVITTDGDLVADAQSGRVKLESIPDAELPDQLQKLTPPQRKAELEKNTAERKTLDQKLVELVKQRDAFAAAERQKRPANARKDSFDQVVEETLRAQVRR